MRELIDHKQETPEVVLVFPEGENVIIMEKKITFYCNQGTNTSRKWEPEKENKIIKGEN